MKINIEHNELLVISDVHIGNPFNKNMGELVKFLDFACDNNYNVCLNGDGLDIIQSSFSKTLFELSEVLDVMRRMKKQSLKIYYIIGNHDIILEHFLIDFGLINFVPFLNVKSGSKRIRIEHGHLYDPLFVNFPFIYEAATWIAGLFLYVMPGLYLWWMRFEKIIFSGTAAIKGSIKGEGPFFIKAARSIVARGFDAIIFGHTHHPGVASLGDGKQYINSGSWLVTLNYIKISNGDISLLYWRK